MTKKIITGAKVTRYNSPEHKAQMRTRPCMFVFLYTLIYLIFIVGTKRSEENEDKPASLYI